MGDNGNLDKGYKDGSNHETCWRDNDNSKRVKMIWFLQIERDVQKKSEEGKDSTMWLTYDDGFWGMKIAHLGIVFIIATLLLYHEKEKKTDTSCCHLSESIKTIASIYVCLPLRRFFSLFIKHRSVFNNGSPPINSFFLGHCSAHTGIASYTR